MWQPGGAPPEPPPASARHFESTDPVAIPDNSAAGAISVIHVPAESGQVTSVQVRIEIEHTYIGDLVVTLEHEGQSVTLHQRTGAGTDDLALSIELDDFAGSAADGDWTLKVRDAANVDTGRIVRWSIDLP